MFACRGAAISSASGRALVPRQGRVPLVNQRRFFVGHGVVRSLEETAIGFFSPLHTSALYRVRSGEGEADVVGDKEPW